MNLTTMNVTRHIASLFVSILLAGVSYSTSASTVSYVLNQSNVLPDDIDYLTVTISNDVDGQLDFWVDIQSPLTDIAGDNFGIQKFSFNLAGDMSAGGYGHPPFGKARGHSRRGEHGRYRRGHQDYKDGRFCYLDSVLSTGDFILPEGWDVRLGKGSHRDGKSDGKSFDVNLLGRGYSRQDPLHFTVLGLGLDDVLAGFAAHVAGFEYIVNGCSGEDGRYGHHKHRCRDITSAWFYGDQPVVIPLPATVWLLGSGLIALVSTGRRRRV